ncbi:MAG: chemotaxis-specific protein-glutamate methyltransferase CheB [Myxococcota bacterium]
MSQARLLIVDDSAAVRRLLQRSLKEHPIEVVGTAASGRDALAEIERHQPDAVTLDIEMPGMTGLEALDQIRVRWPKLPVVMVSSLTSHGAEATVEALTRGASAYVTKPSAGIDSSGIDKVGGRLARRILALVAKHKDVPVDGLIPRPAPNIKHSSAAFCPRPIKAIAISSSVGGPDALRRVLPSLADVRVPIFITQHMPERFTARLAEKLTQGGGPMVSEVSEAQPVLDSKAYLAGGGSHLVVKRAGEGYLAVPSDAPPENHCKPAADVMLRSLSNVYREGLLSLVLTGMGQDALEGSRAIKAKGGLVLAQDEASAVVWGMAGFVTRDGLADAVIPLSELGPSVNRIVVRGRSKGNGR